MRQTSLDDFILDEADAIVPGTGKGDRATATEEFGQMRRGARVVTSADGRESEITVYDCAGEAVLALDVEGRANDDTFRRELLVVIRDALDRVDPLP